MNAKHGIEVRLVDSDGLADNTDPAVLILMLTRGEIESCRQASALERLHVLTDSLENVRRYKGSLIIQVDGYEDDPRELFEIPEVRAFFRGLVQAWPHFLWFAHRGVGSVGLLLALLCDVRLIRNPNGSIGTEFTSLEEVKATLLNLLDRSMALFNTYGIPSHEVTEMIESVLGELGLGEPT